MSQEEQEREAMREQLRGYLLGTLSDAEHASVADRIKGDDLWAAVLEEERAKLDILDQLPDSEPLKGLAENTLERVRMKKKQNARTFDIGALLRPALLTLLATGIILAFVLPSLTRSREAARRASVDNNLRQMGLVFKMYANESRGERFPPAIQIDGAWVPDLRTLYPEYLSDPNILLDPSNPDWDDHDKLINALEKNPPDWDTAHRIVAKNFIYTGYAMRAPEEVEAFADRQHIAMLEPDQDINLEEETIYRLREGIERFYLTDINNPAASAQAQSEIPIMMQNYSDSDRAEKAGGVQVLFLDGRVEIVTPRDPRFRSLIQTYINRLGSTNTKEP